MRIIETARWSVLTQANRRATLSEGELPGGGAELSGKQELLGGAVRLSSTETSISLVV